ncbi:MAG TPA: tetratricopeptide repeat protein, partial [Bryobacteraceae bacterium]|nr:tetratricopeptide repeat protein [Bryobacteraceae bacterium]
MILPFRSRGYAAGRRMIEVRMRHVALLLLLAPQILPGIEPWFRLASPGFELYTDSGEKAGREALVHFEQVRGFFLKASPVPLADQFPVRIVAFNSKEDLRPYAPSSIAAAYFTSSRKRDYIVMQDATAESYGIGTHEYLHLLIRHSGLRIPTWLNEGWADVYSTLRPVRGGVAVGDLIPLRVKTLETSQWLDFDTLTSVNERSPIYNEGNRAGIFYAESWALAHMLFLAPEYQQGFPKFLMALHQGKTSAEACQVAFGRTSQQVFEDLRKYLDRKRLYGRIFEAPLGKLENAPQSSPLSAFDTRIMLADLLATIGKTSEAKREYEQLAQLDPKRAEVNESLGYLALRGNDAASAREYFERAFSSGDADPQMCVELAALERAFRQPPDKIIPPLEQAIRSKPGYTDALLQLGLTKVAMRDFPAAIDTLMRIDKVTPDRAGVVFAALAYAYLRNGDLDRARRSAENAKKWATAPADIENLNRLLVLIEARSTVAFAPRPGEKTAQVEGTLQAIDCQSGATRLRLAPGGKELSFDLP